MTFKATIVVLAAVALVGTLCANGASISSDYDPEDDIAATGPISKFLPGDEDQAIKSRLHKRSTCENDNTQIIPNNGTNDPLWRHYSEAEVKESWQECSDLCRATRQCKYWTWNKDLDRYLSDYPDHPRNFRNIPLVKRVGGRCILSTTKRGVESEIITISGDRACGKDCWFGGWWC